MWVEVGLHEGKVDSWTAVMGVVSAEVGLQVAGQVNLTVEEEGWVVLMVVLFRR